MKYKEYIELTTNDRVSAVLMTIVGFSLIIISHDKVIDLLCIIIGPIALIANIIWCGIILPKKKNAARLSKSQNIVAITEGIFVFLVFMLYGLIPQIFPSWTDTALIVILFALLTFFALSNPAPAQERREM